MTVTEEGVVYRALAFVGPTRLVPASAVRAVTTRDGILFRGSYPFLILNEGRPIMLVGAGHMADARWESEQIARVLRRPWVRWTRRKSLGE